MNFVAKVWKEPATGWWALISPRDCMRSSTMRPIAAYARRAPPGPALATVAPEARNRPVPIAPPMAIICMWRDARPRLSCVLERWRTSLAMSSGVGVSMNGVLICRS